MKGLKSLTSILLYMILLNLSDSPDTVIPDGVIGDVAQHRYSLQGNLKLQCSTLNLQLLQQLEEKSSTEVKNTFLKQTESCVKPTTES